MAINLWFEHVIDAYLQACADERDWREACAVAVQAVGNTPRRVLTQKDLKTKKGLRYSRRHRRRKFAVALSPAPFDLIRAGRGRPLNWRDSSPAQRLSALRTTPEANPPRRAAARRREHRNPCERLNEYGTGTLRTSRPA